jgi:hypothetical protein
MAFSSNAGSNTNATGTEIQDGHLNACVLRSSVPNPVRAQQTDQSCVGAARDRFTASETMYAVTKQKTDDEIEDELDQEARASGFKHSAENWRQVRFELFVPGCCS